MGRKIKLSIDQGLEVPNFFKYILRVSKFALKVGNDLQSLPEGPQMNKWTTRRGIKVSIAQRLDVPIFFKNVPNFLKDVPKIPKLVLK